MADGACRKCATRRLRGWLVEGMNREHLDRLGSELGMPAGVRVVEYIHDPLPAGWQGYSIKNVGCVVPESQVDELTPRDWPAWAGEGQAVQLWRQRVYCGDYLDVYLESRWRPGKGTTQTLRGLEHVRTVAERDAAVRLLNQLKALRELERDTSGRPDGSGEWPEERFKFELRRYYDDWLKTAHCRPSQIEMAVEMGIAPSTFRNYRRDYYGCS